MSGKKPGKSTSRTAQAKSPPAAPDAPAFVAPPEPEAAELPAPPVSIPLPAPEPPAAPAHSPTFAEAVSAAPSATPATPAFSGLLKDFNFSKLFSEMKVPAMPDMEAVLATHKRNLEALSDANRVALEGAQAVARRHMEIVQSTMTEMTDSLKSLSVTEAPATRAAKHAELLKHAYENAVSNTRELGDLIQRSNAEALQKLNHRFSEAMNEVKALFNKL
jgi:phasin family protein